MKKGIVQIYYGNEKEPSAAALGNALVEAGKGKKVIIIEFLKEKKNQELEFLQCLEPEIRFFHFSQTALSFINGFHYGKKVVTTGGCDRIIFDGILEILNEDIIHTEEVKEMLQSGPEEMDVILTGEVLQPQIRAFADEVYQVTIEKPNEMLK